jgi:hypothetical protein
MRYTILKPNTPTDPRHLSFASLEHFRAEFPSIADCDLERQVIEQVRNMYPDAIVMPIPLEVGSGKTMILGVLESADSPTDPNGTIPYVLFVQAISQSGAETALIKRNGQFSRSAWAAPVIAPRGDYELKRVELRGSNIEQPLRINAAVFRRADRHGGHRTIFLDLGEVQMSIELLEDL